MGTTNNAMGKKQIDTAKFYDTHRKIKALVESYQGVNTEVRNITKTVKDNWVGKGRNEFETQYNILIRKIDDFGDTLLDIYNALIEAEASYEDTDDKIRQDFVKAQSQNGWYMVDSKYYKNLYKDKAAEEEKK